MNLYPITMILSLVYCLIVIQIKSVDSAYIYGLMLHNPIPDDLGAKLSGRYTQDDSDKDNSHLSYNEQNNNNGSDLTSAEIYRHRCKQDSDCIDDDSADSEHLMYCDRHYGYCDFFRQVGELCRHDSQCDSGLICMFGRCAKPFKPGHMGSRCHQASDCNAGLCCARQHGERICKPKLQQGQQCFVPLGGLDYSLNELCSCDEGLECQQTKTKNKRKRLWKSDNVMRCLAPKIVKS